MSRYAAIDLAAYPVADILDGVSYESDLAAIKEDFAARWDVLAAAKGLPRFDTLMLESEPVVAVMEVFAYREMILRSLVNDKARSLTLSGASGRALDHIGMTYYRRTVRLEGEDDETFRARIAIAPEAWSSAGPEGAYVFFGYGASSDILDLAVYSVDEGAALPAILRVCVLSKTGDGTASAGLLSVVKQALSKHDRVPTADHVISQTATRVDYTINVDLKVAPGILHAPLIEAATKRLTAWATGKRRWAGDDVEGPVWLIGRTIDAGDLKAIAWAGDPNIVGVEIISPSMTVNPPHAGYSAALAAFLAQQTDPNVVALSDALTAHLFRAPRCTAIAVTASIWNGDQ